MYVVGVYEGSYPSGATHGFNYHRQGEVVLTSYEPVLWKLEGDATQYVTRVFLSGYHAQEISGIGPNVEVINLTYEGGDDEYFYAYDRNSSKFKKLQQYLKNKTNKELPMYFGSYSTKTVNLGQKG